MAQLSEELQTNVEKNKKRLWFKSFQYNEENDSASDTRNVLLIVAALITAVTFQAGVNPPGGVWQENGKPGKPGSAIYATQEIPFYIFLISNTFALSSAILVIVSLTYRFPFHFEIWLATASMLVTYGSAIFAVTPTTVRFRFVLIAAAVPVGLRVMWEVFKLCGFCKRTSR